MRSKKDRALSVDREAARKLYMILHDDKELSDKVRRADSEPDMIELLRSSGYEASSGTISELARLFARELTDEELAKVTGG